VSHVLTLIAPPDGPPLTDALVDRAASFLPAPQPAQWLAPAVAADIRFTPDRPAETIEPRLRGALAGIAVDIVVQPLAQRRKRLLVADMDSTMIAQECIDELAGVAGIKPEVSAITERAMRGEIAFEPALRERVALLAGLRSSVIADLLGTRITLTPGATTLVRTMRAHGARTALVSGGFTAFTGAIAQRIGFDEHHANVLLLDGDTLTGRVEEPILGREAKLATLVRLRQELGIGDSETLAIGDGANDLAMIEAAGLGVAFHAKPLVAAAAPARIDHGDLTAILYLQGYRREEFAE